MALSKALCVSDCISCAFITFQDTPETKVQEELGQYTIRIITKGSTAEDEPFEVGIVLQGPGVMSGLQSVSKACVLG